MINLYESLKLLADAGNADFQARLVPTLQRETMLGVRTPALRKLAREAKDTPEAEAFLQSLPHSLFDENNLHGALISQIADFDQCIVKLDRFLPYVDNWATCDLISPSCFRKHLPQLLPHVRCWMASEHPFTCRFGIGMLMRWFLDDAFQPQYLDWVSSLRSDEYYINMMIAWYFATALAKQYGAAYPYIAEHRLDPWTHNKAIQKACESFRLSPAQKEQLRALRLNRALQK